MYTTIITDEPNKLIVEIKIIKKTSVTDMLNISLLCNNIHLPTFTKKPS